MVTRVAVLDGIEHTFLKPVINSVRDDINSKLIKDPEIYNHNLGNYEDENITLDNNVYDNTISGPILNYSYKVTDEETGLHLGMSSYTPLNKIVLLDKDNGFNIRPNYKPVKITITFTYLTQSKTLANRVKDRLKSHYDTSSYMIPHNVPYSYLIPNNMLGLMNDIKNLKDPSMTLEEYITSIGVYNLDVTVKHSDDRRTPVFHGVFANILGRIETLPSDLEVTKRDDEYYSLQFETSLTVKQPYSLSVQYPILINNKMLPKLWLPPDSVGAIVEDAEGVMSITRIVNNYTNLRDSDYNMAHIPSYDDFYPLSYNDKSMMRLVSILLEVDSDDDTLIFNVNDLRYIGIPPPLIDYFNKCDETELFLFSYCLIHIELYDGNDKKDYKLTKNDDGEIRTSKPLLMTSSYHIVINVVLDRAFINYNGSIYPNSEKVIRDEEIIQRYKFPMKGIGRNILPVKIQ